MSDDELKENLYHIANNHIPDMTYPAGMLQDMKQLTEQYALTKQLEELEYIPTKLVHIKDGLGLDCGTVNALDPYYRDNRIADLRSQLTSNKSKD